jgi:predicted enzyme related to lactoylglutathione lyase
MPLNEYQSKEALRVATDWLTETDPPGGAAAREGIANVIPLLMMGAVEARDLDELASIVEENGAAMHDPAVPLETHRAELHDAVKAAFDHVKAQSGS